MQKEFKVGQTVRIRQWDDMASEFGISSYENIRCATSFTPSMKHLCGRVATITYLEGNIIELDFEDKSGDISWDFTTDMLEPVMCKASLKPTDIVKYRNGQIGIILHNHFSKDGLGVFSINPKDCGCIGYLSDFCNDLTNSIMKHRDIMAVYTTKTAEYSVLKKFFNQGIFEEKWTWERDEPKVKELTVEEATKLLKEKFKEFEEIKITV